MKFHPDRQGISSDANSNTTIAREVNLQALQTLNGMIDTIDQIHTRASASASDSNSNSNSNSNSRPSKGRIELHNTYTIEFLVSSNHNTHTAVKKRKEGPSSSRRSVELLFSERDIDSVQRMDSRTGRYSMRAADALKGKAMGEVGKLLRVAGLAVPNDLRAQMDAARSRSRSRSLEEELSFGFGEEGGENNTFGRNFQYSRTAPRTRTPYEESREKYMNSVDWKKYNIMYDEALEDMERDLATEGLIAMSEERKQRLVAQVISKVRVLDEADAMHSASEGSGSRSSSGSVSNDGEMDAMDEIDEMIDDAQGIDPLSQLIAIRRLSLLLNDNFDALEMEEMGRLWETMVIVLTPERNTHQHLVNGGKTGLPYSRLKRLKKGRESGFKFAFHSDDRVTVYVPIDFLDDELLGEMKVHLADFYSLCLSKGGLEDYFPSHYAEFKGQANFD
jgi:hypothetical protein